MKRNTLVRLALLATPLLAFLLYAALNWFRIVEEKTWVGMGPEARRDPYLAYSRLLSRMNTPATFGEMSAILAAPPERGLVMLAAGRLVYSTPDRVKRLADWVRRGGTLVLEAEPVGIDDPLLAAFDVDRESRESEARAPKKMRVPLANTVADFDWLGTGEALQIDFDHRAQGLVPPRNSRDLVVASAAGHVLALAFPVGEGRLVVLSSFAFLRNGPIRSRDHAELGWQIASHGAKRGGAQIYLRHAQTSLDDWLVGEAWPALVAAALFVALWVARIVPRFGPLAPEAPPVRRRIVEHVAASGRFLWSRGASAFLLEAARERVWRTAVRRFPRLGPVAAAAIEKMADALGVSRPKARRALAEPVAGEAAFVDAVKALQEIDTRLSKKGQT